MNGLAHQIHRLLLLNNISIDKQELTFQIQSHPSYPSLHAVTGVLDHFNIDNLALDIPINKETLVQLPKSFLAQMKTDQGKEFNVASNNNSQYTLLSGDNKKKVVSIDSFLSQFTGIMIAVEKTELVEDRKTTANFSKNTVFGVFFVLVFGLLILSKPSVLSTLFLVVCLLGVFVSITLKKQEQGEETTLGKAFCSGASEYKDCDTVLSSKGARILGNFKLSDLSFIYFTGLAFSVFLLMLLGENVSVPYVVSFIAFPVTVYSIYYQYVVLKSWCLLCVSVVALIWIQVGISLFGFDSHTASISLNTTALVAFSFISVLVLWNSIAPQLNGIKDLKDTRLKYFKFKRNFNLFYTLLIQSKSIDTSIKDAPEIVFGTMESPLQITVITNPFCGHCKAVHDLVENILSKQREKVSITIRFSVNPNYPESDLVKITSRLLELYHEESNDRCLKAMHHIYDGMPPEQWFNEFGLAQNKNYLQILEKENRWCEEHTINFTPEILINGRSFPKEYDRSDLLFFIEDLNENCAISSQEDTAHATH